MNGFCLQRKVSGSIFHFLSASSFLWRARQRQGGATFINIEVRWEAGDDDDCEVDDDEDDDDDHHNYDNFDRGI